MTSGQIPERIALHVAGPAGPAVLSRVRAKSGHLAYSRQRHRHGKEIAMSFTRGAPPSDVSA